MSILHDTLRKYISTQDGDAELKSRALKQLEAEIIQEIVSLKANEIAKVAADREKKRLTSVRRQEMVRKLQDAQRAFFIVVILGLLVGMVGNQFTEMISALKNSADAFWMGTIGALALLLASVYAIFRSKYFAIADKMLEKILRETNEE